MNKELLERFFRALRVSLTNAFAYSKTHPYFIKSVENFKTVLEDTLAVLNPLKIAITSQNILVNQEELPENGFYDELVGIFHQRKIKSVEIRSGADLGELVEFLSLISLPPKDILAAGGISAILEDKILVHFTIEELDYSELLLQEGQDCSDIWGYLFKNTAQKNTLNLDKLVDDFSLLIKRSDQHDLLEVPALPESIGDFLSALKEKNKEKFDKCSKDVFLWLLHNKKSLNDDELKKLAPILKSLNQEDFSNLLWEGITQDDHFDSLSLQLFSKISEQKGPLDIAKRFLTKLNQSQALKNNSHAVKRIKNLLNPQKSDQVSDVYQHTLEFLVKDISLSQGVSFDRQSLGQNYRYIILAILGLGDDYASGCSEILIDQLPKIWKDNDFEFLKALVDLLKAKRKESQDVYALLENKLTVFLENIALNEGLAREQEFVLDLIAAPSQDIKIYLDKIFNGGHVNVQLLALFFRLFSQDLVLFYRRLESRSADLEYLAGLIDALGQIDSRISGLVLEHIYSFANELIKAEVLKAMAKLKEKDVDFLMQQLETCSPALRRSIFSILILDDQAQDQAVKKLLDRHDFWGKNNNLLMENIQIIADLKFIPGVIWLQKLSQKRFFWNLKLRNKAKQALKEFNVR